MDQNKIYSLVHHLGEASNIINELGLFHHKFDDIQPVGENLKQLVSGAKSLIGDDTHGNRLTDDSVIDDGGTSEVPFEEQVEQAYNILKTESRPGPTLVSRKMGITMVDARKLYTNLIDSGRIVKGQRAVDHLPNEGKDGSAKPKTPPSDNNVIDLINQLPEGSDLLIPKHLQQLIALPAGKRGPYLSGLNIEDLIDADDIGRATVNGANTILVDEIIKLTKSKPPKVKKTEIIQAKKDGNEREQKYFRVRSRIIKAIPNGKELYKHMAENGLTKRVLHDLKTIAQAVTTSRV